LGPNPKPPIPNPQSPIPNKILLLYIKYKFQNEKF